MNEPDPLMAAPENIDSACDDLRLMALQIRDDAERIKEYQEVPGLTMGEEDELDELRTLLQALAGTLADLRKRVQDRHENA